MSLIKSFNLYLLFIFLLIINYTKSQQYHDFVDTINSAYYRDNNQNVTCIPHDSKITCDCGNTEQKMILQPLSGHFRHISISNCKSVTIAPMALINTYGIRSISLTNIDSLVLEENAFSFPERISNNPLIMEFNKVNIEEIKSHAITGNIEEISFSFGQIATIRPFGISALKDNAILLKFSNMFVDRIEPQAFKKFNVEQFEISNTVITSNIPSKGFYELEVKNTFKISNSTFKEIHSRAFTFQNIGKLILIENHFDLVDGEWIKSDIQESVLIRNNYFGILNQLVFSGLSVHRNYISSENMEFKFYNNSMNYSISNDIVPLKFNKNFHLIISNLYYLKMFNCNLKSKLSSSDFFKMNSDVIYFKITNDNRQNDKNSEYSNLTKVLSTDCTEKSYVIYIIVGVILLILFISILIGIFVYQRIKKKNKQKLDLVVPEPRTYRETQIVLQIENAGLLKTDM